MAQGEAGNTSGSIEIRNLEQVADKVAANKVAVAEMAEEVIAAALTQESDTATAQFLLAHRVQLRDSQEDLAMVTTLTRVLLV